MPDRNTDGTLSILLISSVFLAFPAWAGDVEVQLGAGDGFVIKDSTVTERWRVDESGNLTRSGSLFLHEGNISVFLGSLAGSANSGLGNSGFGIQSLSVNTTGIRNSAFGMLALGANSTGHRNSAFGSFALDANTTASNNSAFGYASLGANITGTGNSAFGSFALDANTTASNNSAFGYASLGANETGTGNSAFGSQALLNNTTDSSNSAFGFNALSSLSSGNTNIGVGLAAGGQLTTGSNNIYIGNVGAGTESGQLRIGSLGVQTNAFVAGIAGNVVTGSAVLVSGTGELGVAASSLRFKHSVRDLGDSSGMLMSLRPVTFRYREEYVGPDDTTHFGLIAEEVAMVAPGLVHFDDEGRPFSVRYEFLAPLLLNELQGQGQTISRQQAVIAALVERVESLESRLATGTTQVEQ
jgi:hypothetical protein